MPPEVHFFEVEASALSPKVPGSRVEPLSGNRHWLLVGGLTAMLVIAMLIIGCLSTGASQTQTHSCAGLLGRVSDVEMAALKRLFVVSGEEMGQGWDVRDHRGKYNNLAVKAAWKLQNDYLDAYFKTRDKLNARYAGKKYWMSTAHDGLQRELHTGNLLLENEYLLFRGSKPESLEYLICKETSRTEFAESSSIYGYGVYMADFADKADQYILGDVNLTYLTKLVGKEDPQIRFLHGLLDESQSGIFLMPVVRAYLGRHIQVSFQNDSPYFTTPRINKSRTWHYLDPLTGKHLVVNDTPGHGRFNKAIPPDFGDIDSVKVMSRFRQPNFSRDYFSKPEAASPWRHDEYFIPKALVNEQIPRFAVQYLVAYQRVNSSSDPSKVFA